MKKASSAQPIFRYATAQTAIGPILAVATDKGLCALRLLEGTAVKNLMREIAREHPPADWVEDGSALRPYMSKISQVVEGHLDASKIPLDLYGTPFQKKVWSTLLRVPWGKTLSYQELARKVGKPRAVRAVANACARNPIAFVVPCHRILRSDGSLGGYYWGPSRKQQLLRREREES